LFLSNLRKEHKKEVINKMSIPIRLIKVVYSAAALAILLGALFAYTVPKVAAAPAYDYELIYQSPYPSALAPGETTNVWIEVKNTGTATWYNSGTYITRLGTGSAYGAANQQRDYASEFANDDWLSTNRPVAIMHPEIRPGWHTRFQFNIKAPSTPGVYKAYFTPVVDGLTWMKDIGIYWQITVTEEEGEGEEGEEQPPTGELSVSLASDTPAAQTVLKAATGVPYLKFNIQSPDTINEIVIKRTGVGDASDFDNVYLYDGATRLTSGRSVSTDTHTATFTNLNLDATSTKTLTVKADIDASAGTSNQSAFEVYSVDGTSVSGVVGNTMTIGSQTMSAATIAENGASWSVTLGSSDAEVAKFSINASSATNDLTLEAITLRQSGSLSNSYLSNLVLKEGSNELATVSSMDGEKAVFVLSTPYTITKGQTKYFIVYADITGGRTTDDIKFYLDEKTDLTLLDSVYGFGVNLTNSWSYGDQTVSMIGGTITLANNGPSVTTYATNSTQNLFLDLNVSSERNVTVKKSKIKMQIYNNGTSDYEVYGTNYQYLKNIRIVDLVTGNTVVGPLAQASSGTCVEVTDNGGTPSVCEATDTVYYEYEFSDQFDLTAGQTRNLGLKADIDTSFTTANRTIRLVLDLSGSNYLYDNDASEYVSSGDIVPSSVTGNWMNVGSDSMTVAMASTPVSSTTVRRTSDVASIGYLFKSGDTNSSKITKLIVTGQGDTANDGFTAGELDDVISSLSLYVDGSKVAGPVSVNTSGVATFNNLSISIDPGETKKIEIYADISSTAGDNTTPYEYWLGINAATDITVENGDGNSFTATAADGTWDADETNATPTVEIYVRASGTISVAKDPATPDNALVIAGATDSTVAKFKFTTQYEAFTINKLRLKIDSDNDGAADSNSDNNIDSIKIEANGVSATGYVSGGQIDFSNLGITAAKDDTTTITVKINYKSISGGATSGEKVEVLFEADDNFEAVGDGSGVTITDAGTDVTDAGIMVVRKSKPVVTLDALPSTTLADGTMTIAKFTVTADTDDIAIKKLSFDLTLSDADAGASSNLAIASPAIYDASNPSTAISATFGDGAGGTDYEGQGAILLEFTNEEQIGTGSSKTYELRATISGSAQYDSVLCKLMSPRSTEDEITEVRTAYLDDNANELVILDSAQDGTGTEYAASMIWSDVSAASHSDNDSGTGSGDWTNVYLVNLPTSYQTMSR